MASQSSKGLIIEGFCRLVRDTALQPGLTVPLLAAALLGPRWASSRYARALTISPTVAGALGAIVVTGVLYRLNRMLSRMALNNWTTDRSWDWHKEIVLVTGGCSGIGQEIAQQLAERGIKVVVLDLGPPQTTRPNIHYYKTDITSSSEIAEVAAAIRRDIGEPTVVVNNAGIGYPRTVLTETESRIRRSFEVNNIAHFLMVKEFAPHMIKTNHGHIVTMASLASFVSFGSNVVYGCTKSAALAFHEGLVQELRHIYNAKKVRTTVVHPTWVRTPMIQDSTQAAGWNELTIDPKAVAHDVVTQVLCGESAQLILPGRYNLLPMLRGAPSWLQEGLRDARQEILR